MPSLDWIGKKKVVNHHLEVPFRVLEKKYDFYAEGGESLPLSPAGKPSFATPSPKGDTPLKTPENRIIHGDNLEALKSLLPEYEGRIDCIYIDPPYNTGNEGWVYNDNVNDPRIKKWLGEVVGKESEDFTRHDKWLCMMYPRLKLLQKLLSEKGAIFISIDDNEEANLKLVCDEIFGSGNFVANISWQRTYSMRNDVKGIASEVESVLVYSKNPCWQPNRLQRTEEMDSKYKNPDNDPKGAWRNIVASAPGAATHQGMVYAIQNPLTGDFAYPPQGRCWSLGQDQMLNAMNEWCNYELKDLHDIEKRAEMCGVSKDKVKKDVLAIVIKDDLETAKQKVLNILNNGVLPEFYFSKQGYGTLSRKAYLNSVSGRHVTNFWSFEECGHTDEASRLLKTLFDGKTVFDTPKPTRLIERILQIATDKDSIILDSFAGSGTTAHAVLNMNRKDGGRRRFILIEMMDYAETITAERLKRVIKNYEKEKQTDLFASNDAHEKEKRSPLGLSKSACYESFSFYELGEPLLINNLLNEKVDTQTIREYIWFTETGRKIPDEPPKQVRGDGHAKLVSASENQYFLGCNYGAAYWFYYEKEKATTLDIDFLSTIKGKYEQYIIYADICLIPQDLLQKNNIIFKKIPRDIKKF